MQKGSFHLLLLPAVAGCSCPLKFPYNLSQQAEHITFLEERSYENNNKVTRRNGGLGSR
jgi:hypothetical protein